MPDPRSFCERADRQFCARRGLAGRQQRPGGEYVDISTSQIMTLLERETPAN